MKRRSYDSRRRATSVAGLGTFVLILLTSAGTSVAQYGQALLAIKDTAGLFSKRAIEQVTELTPEGTLPCWVGIETIEELGGETIEEATRSHAERSGREGVYILISRRDHKIDVRVSRPFEVFVPEADREKIQNAIIQGLKSGDPDAGLRAGVTELKKLGPRSKGPTNLSANAAGAGDQRSSASAPEDGNAPLVLRNQARLTLAGAQRIIAGAEAKAAAMGVKVNIAVVDVGGHMFAFERMDGARPASIYTATTKAVTAATFRAPSGPVPPGTTTPDLLLNLSLQNAAFASGGKLTTLGGGLPVVVENQVIGAVGVGGGSSEQDIAVARAGIEAFNAGLKPAGEGSRDKNAASDDK